MKVKTVSALAGLGGALILSSSANAGFTGLELVDVTAYYGPAGTAAAAVRTSFANAGGATAYSVYRVYAKFDGTTANDRVVAVGGSPAVSPAFINVTSGSVFNYLTGGNSTTPTITHYNLPAPSNAAGDNANRGWETWATIGPAFGANLTGFTPGAHDAGQMNNFQGSWSSTAAWFITPADAQGLATSNTNTQLGSLGPKVLIFQIAVAAGSQFNGRFNVGVGTANIGQNNLTFANVIPGPGALALLGLAGLVGHRRRRA